MSKVSNILAAAVLVCVFSMTASASVTYSLQAFTSFTNESGYFTVTTPDFITSVATFFPAQLDSGNVQVGGVDASLLPVSFFPSSNGFDKVAFGSNFFNYYSFADGAFSAFGSYDTLEWGASQAGHLDVQAAASVPEPSTIFLLVSGLGGFVLLGSSILARRAAGR